MKDVLRAMRNCIIQLREETLPLISTYSLMYSTIGLKIYGRKLKIHVIPQGEHRDAEENKPKGTPMD